MPTDGDDLWVRRFVARVHAHMKPASPSGSPRRRLVNRIDITEAGYDLMVRSLASASKPWRRIRILRTHWVVNLKLRGWVVEPRRSHMLWSDEPQGLRNLRRLLRTHELVRVCGLNFLLVDKDRAGCLAGVLDVFTYAVSGNPTDDLVFLCFVEDE